MVLIFVYSDKVLGTGWPNNFGYGSCGNARNRGFWECFERIRAVRIIMAVSAGAGILIGVLLGIVLVLRLAALARTISFQGKVDWNSASLVGPTVQLNVSNKRPVEAGNLPPSSEEARLIET